MYCYHCMKQVADGSQFCFGCGKSLVPDDIPHHLAPGTVLNKRYLVGNSIGEGGFGITYVGLDMNLNMKIAVKEFFPNGYANRNNKVTSRVTLNIRNEGEYFKDGRKQFLREAQSLAKFSQESGIVDVRDYFTENDTAYIVMEYVDGLTLSQHIKQKGLFEPTDIFQRMLPIMRSLEKMHSENIIHRDISPDNIKVTQDGSLKLMDFGSARYFSGSQKKTMSVVLKHGYAPYEQYSSEGNQGPWTDVYGLCSTIYKCITGATPPNSLDRTQRDGLKKPSGQGVKLSENLQNVLMFGLAVYPENRCPNMTMLIQITEAALRNENITYKGSNAVEERIIRTKKEDERYKTLFMGNNGGSPTARGSDVTVPIQSFDGSTYPISTEPEKKMSKGLLALIIILPILLMTTIGALTAFIVVTNSKGGFADAIQSATTVSTEDLRSDLSAAATEQPTESNEIEMTNVKGKKLSDAQRELTALGLSVEVKEEHSSSVPKDYVIEQSVRSGDSVKKGDSVTLVVSKGEAVNDKPYNQKVVVTASSGSSYGTMEVFNWENGEWVSQFECDTTVGKGGISSDNSESNTLTPKGEFPLGVVLTASGVSTNLQTVTVHAGTVVCDDTSYPQYYNQIFNKSDLPSGVSSDPVGKKLTNGQNNALIFIEHNGNGFTSQGVSIYNSSVITICGCYNSIAPTGGCIDISASDMNSLLHVLDAAKNPYIITEVD